MHRRVAGDGDDHADRVRRRLRVAQLTQADDVAGRLLDPVASGDPDVEQPLGDVGRDLLRSQDAHLGDPRVVDRRPVLDGDERTTARSAASKSSSVARSSDPLGSTMRSTAPDAIGRAAGAARRFPPPRSVLGRGGVEQAQGVGQHVEDRRRAARRSPSASRACCTRSACPRIPATPRDSRPSGLIRRIASASPGASRSMTCRVPSGVWSRGANPVPPVVTTRPAKPSVSSVRAAATAAAPSVGDAVLDDLEPGRGQLLDERPTAGVVAGAVGHAVADRQHLGPQHVVAHPRDATGRRPPPECLLRPRVCCGASRPQTLGWPETLGWMGGDGVRGRGARRGSGGRRWRSRTSASAACPPAAR